MSRRAAQTLNYSQTHGHCLCKILPFGVNFTSKHSLIFVNLHLVVMLNFLLGSQDIFWGGCVKKKGGGGVFFFVI